MTTSFADGLSEEEFRRSIEARLRENRPEEAVKRLRRLLADDAGPGGVLPSRFLSVQSSDLELDGWDELATRIRAYDEPGRPITAVSIAFAWPGENPPQPDERGQLRPLIETEYFNDSAYPFSDSDRDNLIEGYSYYGCTWAGEGKATDTTLTLRGVDDLHGALALLEARLLSMDEPDEDEIRAGSLGACLLSVLLFQAVGERITRDGLPRPVCVMAGSNGVYPYFDAPVAGMPEQVLKDGSAEISGAAAYIPGPRYSSLLVAGIPRARKRAVLVIEESENESAARLANLRGLHHRDEVPEPAQGAPDAEPTAEPLPELAAIAPDGEAIIPNPAGPLLVKRKPAQSWDFRDLLTPEGPPHGDVRQGPPPPIDLTPPEPDVAEPAPADSELAAPEVDQDLPSKPPQPPAAEPEPAALAPAALSRIQPGFTSFEIDLNIESRLKALIAMSAMTPELQPGPEPRPQAEPQGIAWPEEADRPPAAEALEPEPEPRPSLLARLLAWLPWR